MAEQTTLPYILVTSSLKKAVTVSLLGLMAGGAAVTVTFARKVEYSRMWNSLTDSKNGKITKFYNDFADRVKTGYTKVSQEYTNTYNHTATEADDDFQKLKQQWKKGEELVGEAGDMLGSENVKSYNYYSFVNRELINSLVLHIPSMIRDSIKDGLDYDGEIYELLSFRKISHILHHEKFKEFLKALSDLEKQKNKLISTMTAEDAHGLMEVLRSLPFEEGGSTPNKTSPRITRFLEETTKNMKRIVEDSTKTFKTAKELIIEVLMGTEAQKEIYTNLENVIKQLKEKITDISQKSNLSTEVVNSAKAYLELLKPLLEKFKPGAAAGKAS